VLSERVGLPVFMDNDATSPAAARRRVGHAADQWRGRELNDVRQPPGDDEVRLVPRPVLDEHVMAGECDAHGGELLREADLG